jgi:hypothetical protein
MEAHKLIAKELIWGFYHNKRLDVLFLIVEGRVGFDGALMVALRVEASISVGSLDGFSVLNFVVDQSVLQAVTEQERLKLDQNCLNGICRCPTLIDLLLVRIKDVKTDAGASWNVGMLDRSEQSDSRRSYRVILWESYLNMEDTTFEGRPDGSSEVSVPGVEGRGEGASGYADKRNRAFLKLLEILLETTS